MLGASIQHPPNANKYAKAVFPLKSPFLWKFQNIPVRIRSLMYESVHGALFAFSHNNLINLVLP